MGEDLELFTAAAKLQHSESPLDVYADCVIKPCVEIDTGCTIDDHVAVFGEFLEAGGAET